MSCNRIQLRELGRQCCFLNLTSGATETRGNERVQDTPTRRHIYGFFTGYNWWLDFNFVKGKRAWAACALDSSHLRMHMHVNIFFQNIYIYIYEWIVNFYLIFRQLSLLCTAKKKKKKLIAMRDPNSLPHICIYIYIYIYIDCTCWFLNTPQCPVMVANGVFFN